MYRSKSVMGDLIWLKLHFLIFDLWNVRLQSKHVHHINITAQRECFGLMFEWFTSYKEKLHPTWSNFLVFRWRCWVKKISQELLCDLKNKNAKMQNDVSGICLRKKCSFKWCWRVGRYRTEHGQNSTQDESTSERFRELNRQCYLLERGLLCDPCYQWAIGWKQDISAL